MIKTQRTQLKMTEEMEAWVDNYKVEKGFQYRTEAILDLLAFAIRIKENAKDDDSISNRELLEEILYRTIMTEKTARTTLGHSYIKGKLQDDELRGLVANVINIMEGESVTIKDSILKKE